jgi:putative transcriptional regulator
MESLLSVKSERRLCMKNRLEELRKARGLRQEELAEALEVSRQTIGSLENGRYNPSILLAFKLSRYFGVAIEEIFIYEEELS